MLVSGLTMVANLKRCVKVPCQKTQRVRRNISQALYTSQGRGVVGSEKHTTVPRQLCCSNTSVEEASDLSKVAKEERRGARRAKAPSIEDEQERGQGGRRRPPRRKTVQPTVQSVFHRPPVAPTRQSESKAYRHRRHTRRHAFPNAVRGRAGEGGARDNLRLATS